MKESSKTVLRVIVLVLLYAGTIPEAVAQRQHVATSPAISRSSQDLHTVSGDPKIDGVLAAELDQLVERQMEVDGAIGVAIAIIADGEIKYEKGYGLSDRDKRTPVSKDSMFRWASISKPLTAVAAMQLFQLGKLDLNADVRQLVPEFPDHGQKLTAKHLLCHQGGVVHYQNGKVIVTQTEYESEHPFADVVTALDTFKESPLLFKPGTAYSYTTHGYILLSAVVQRAGNQPFHEQIDERIAKVCKMSTLRPDYQWESIPNRVTGYRRILGAIIESDPADVSWKLGGGGYISTIGDMARFGCGLINGQLVNSDTEALMWMPQVTSEGNVTSYGLGFTVTGEGESLRVSHSGSQAKTRTLLVIYPERKSGFAIATNSEWVNPQHYGKLIEKTLTKALHLEE